MKMNGKLAITHRVPETKYKKTEIPWYVCHEWLEKCDTYFATSVCMCVWVWLKNCFNYFHETLCWVILLQWTFYMTTFHHYCMHIKCTSLNMYHSNTHFEPNLYKNTKHIFSVQHMTGFLITKKKTDKCAKTVKPWVHFLIFLCI